MTLNFKEEETEGVIKEEAKRIPPIKRAMTEKLDYRRNQKVEFSEIEVMRDNSDIVSKLKTEPSKKEIIQEERQQKQKEILSLFVNLQFQQAAVKARKVYQLSSAAFTKDDSISPYAVIGDGMLLVKILLNADKIMEAREVLLEIWEITQRCVKDTRVVLNNKESEQNKKRKLPQFKQNTTNYVNDPSISYKHRTEINE